MAELTPTNPELRISAGPDGLLSLAGELDVASTPQLRAAMQQQIDAGVQRCVLDLKDLSFCDSSGLTALLWAEQTFPDGILLHRPDRQLRKILQATQLDQALAIE